MAFLFGRSRPRPAQDIVRSVRDLLLRIQSGPEDPKVEEELSRSLALAKTTLQGSPDIEPDAAQTQALVIALLSDGVLPLLVQNIHRLPFEARKDTSTIISNVFRFRNPGPNRNGTSGGGSTGNLNNEPDALSEVLRTQPDIITALCRGYSRRESAAACGGILKEALKWDAVAAVIFYDERTAEGEGLTVDIYNGNIDVLAPSSGRGVFWSFFDWIDGSSFEVSADAFDCFRLLLTKHKPLAAQFISTNFDRFFARYNDTLVKSESYVTKRQSLKLLGEILLDRAFYDVMTRYVDSGDNLKLIMWQLKDERRMVQYEAFHVFKIFAANPNKSPAVLKFLIMNKQRLLKFLPTFLEDRTDDEQFNDEKAWLVKAISGLPDTYSPSMSSSSSSGNAAAQTTGSPSGGSGAGLPRAQQAQGVRS